MARHLLPNLGVAIENHGIVVTLWSGQILIDHQPQNFTLAIWPIRQRHLSSMTSSRADMGETMFWNATFQQSETLGSRVVLVLSHCQRMSRDKFFRQASLSLMVGS